MALGIRNHFRLKYRVMESVILSEKLPVLVWCAISKTPCNQQNLSLISQWWKNLSGQSVLWKVFYLPSSTCFFPYQCKIEAAWLEADYFCLKKTKMEESCQIRPKELLLDVELQELTIIPYSDFPYRYRLGVVDCYDSVATA
jgi:hypothetical protein